jgi:hypothetical protein
MQRCVCTETLRDTQMRVYMNYVLMYANLCNEKTAIGLKIVSSISFFSILFI